MSEPTMVLKGIGGSHAHGLATESSDQDLVGIFSWPTVDFYTLSAPQESIVRHDPQDEAYHEIRKFCSLAAKSNPTVLETLYLDSYLERTIWGNLLIEIRGAFPSKQYVMNAYIGYSESQFRKMMSATNGDARSRSPKHATHMLRLMEQGRHLYETGELLVKVTNPEQYREWTTWPTDRLADEWTHQWSNFLDAKCGIPDEPDYDLINEFLINYRKAH